METGVDRPRRSPPPWVAWTVGAVALILITAANLVVVGELALRSLEADNLVRAVEKSEEAMKSTQEAFDEVVSAYDSETLTDAEREQLRADLSRVAADGEVAIAEAGDQVGLVVILPWHPQLLAAQDAYLAHNRAWVAYMAAAAEDPAEWFRPQPDVNSTFADARLPLVESVPLFDPLGTLARIELIYVTGSEGSGDGQSA